MTSFIINCRFKINEVRAALSLTQLSSSDGEVPLQHDELLNALGVGRGLLVDPVDPLLDGGVHRSVAAARHLGDACGVAAQLPAELHGGWRQLVLGVAGVAVDLTLHGGQTHIYSIV